MLLPNGLCIYHIVLRDQETGEKFRVSGIPATDLDSLAQETRQVLRHFIGGNAESLPPLSQFRQRMMESSIPDGVMASLSVVLYWNIMANILLGHGDEVPMGTPDDLEEAIMTLDIFNRSQRRSQLNDKTVRN